MAAAPTTNATAPKSRKIFPPRFSAVGGSWVPSGVGLTTGICVAVGLGEGVTVGVADGVGLGLGFAVGVADGLGDGVTEEAPFTWTTAALVRTLPVLLLYSQ